MPPPLGRLLSPPAHSGRNPSSLQRRGTTNGHGPAEIGVPRPPTCLCRPGSAQSTRLGGKVVGCLCGLLLREGAFSLCARRAVYMQVTTGPRLLMTQVISLECLLRLPRGSLQHHNVLSATRTPRDLRRRAPPRAPRATPRSGHAGTSIDPPTCPTELLCSQPTPKNALSKSAYR